MSCRSSRDARRSPTPGRPSPPGSATRWSGTGLDHPMSSSFAPTGKVFVAEKGGVINVYDSLTDTSATVFANLNTKVHNYWDRGPDGPGRRPAVPDPAVRLRPVRLRPPPGRRRPRPPSWPAERSPGSPYDDRCPNPPRQHRRLHDLGPAVPADRRAGGVGDRHEHVLIEDWCQQYPSHSLGSLRSGRKARCTSSGGDGASFNGAGLRPARRHAAGHADAGQPVRRSAAAGPVPPTAEGGALRVAGHADHRRPGRPRRRRSSGSTPTPGAAWPDNANVGSSDANAHRIIAYGLRNPFRFTIRPGTARSGSATSASPRGRRSTGSPIPTRRRATSAGRATRATRSPPAYAGLGLSLCNRPDRRPR